MNDKRGQIINVALAEYQGLRAELMEHAHGIYLILAVSAIIITSIFYAGSANWNNVIIPAILFNVMMPLIFLVIIISVLISSRKGMVISIYIRNNIEKKFEALLGDELKNWLNEINPTSNILPTNGVMGWEVWVRKIGNKKHLPEGYYSSAFSIIFICLLVASLVAGEYRVIADTNTHVWVNYSTGIRVILGLFPILPICLAIFGSYNWYKDLIRLNRAVEN